MKLLMTVYYDKKLGVYTNPMFDRESSDENLIEMTRRMCANPEIPRSFFDYDLYRLGIFDDKDGSFDILEKPVYLCSLGDFAHLVSKESEVSQHVS